MVTAILAGSTVAARTSPGQRGRKDDHVRRPLLWLLLAGLAIALLFLILHHEEGSVGSLSNGDFSSLAYGVALLVFLGGTALTLFRERFAQALTALLLWAAVALLLVVGYSYRFELHEVADRVMAELVPGHVISHGRSVEVARAVSGDFDVSAQINGARVAMVLDTGASSVVLTRDDAKAAGLPLEVLAYTVPIDTANGRARAASVRLDRIAVGGLVERSVEALVAQPGQLKMSLLGMSFLNRLQSWEVRGDRLFLRGYP
jgi:aspartyl protease family protein